LAAYVRPSVLPQAAANNQFQRTGAGVSFRAFVQETGTRLGLSGWVRNVGDDQVETLAEGERAALEEFAQAVQTGPRASYVEAARVEWEAATGEFRWFEVRHSW